MTHSADSTTAERRPYVVRTSGDPSASPPEFGVSQAWDTNPDTWVDGIWQGTFDAENKIIGALSPLIGASQDLAVTAGLYVIYIRWTIGDETPTRAIDQIQFY